MQDDEDPPGKQVFDHNDLLVFIARDLGDRDLEVEKALKATGGDEIEVTDPVNGAKGWAYLADYAASPPAPSATQYMHYQAKERRLVSPAYAFSFSDTKVALVEDLAVQGTPVLDRSRIYGRTQISLGPIEKQVRFTEEDVHGHLMGYIAGPVRIVTRSRACIDLGFGICSPEVFCLHFYYRDYAKVPACLLVRFRVSVVQRKTGQAVRFELTEQTRDAVGAWIAATGQRPEQFLFPSRHSKSAQLSTRPYSRVIGV
jgi:hypothetical protein